jgi:hypothetical protein
MPINLEAAMVEEMKRHPRLLIIIFAVALILGTYGVQTFAEKKEVSVIEQDLNSKLTDLKTNVALEFRMVDKRLLQYERVAEKRHLEGRIDSINTELFNLQEVILPVTNQPTTIKQQIYKYKISGDRLTKELERVNQSISELVGI